MNNATGGNPWRPCKYRFSSNFGPMTVASISGSCLGQSGCGEELNSTLFSAVSYRNSHTVLCLVAQSYQTFCDPMGWSPPGSFVHGISQARILEWVAMPSSRGSSQPTDRTRVSRIAGRFFFHLSHQGSLRILEWVASPFSGGSYWPMNLTEVSCIAGGFFPSRATREAIILSWINKNPVTLQHFWCSILIQVLMQMSDEKTFSVQTSLEFRFVG